MDYLKAAKTRMHPLFTTSEKVFQFRSLPVGVKINMKIGPSSVSLKVWFGFNCLYWLISPPKKFKSGNRVFNDHENVVHVVVTACYCCSS